MAAKVGTAMYPTRTDRKYDTIARRDPVEKFDMSSDTLLRRCYEHLVDPQSEDVRRALVADLDRFLNC